MAERADLRESQDDSDQVGGRQGQVCEPCKKKNKVRTATLFCVDCKLYQCDKCSKVHEIYDALSGHKVVEAHEALFLKPVLDMKGLDKCKDHDKPFEFYCIDEQKLCCNTCAIASHRGCTEVNEISTETKKSAVNTSFVESTIRELQGAARHLAELLEKTKATTSTKLEALLDYIEGIKRTLISNFDQIMAALTEQFQSMEDKRLELLKTNSATIKNISEDLHEKQEYLNMAKTCGTPDQLFIATHVIKKHITPYKLTLDDQRTNLYTVDCSIECSENLQEILKSNISLATFSVDKIPIDPSIPSVEKAMQLKLVKSVDVKQGKDDTGVPFYTGIDFLTDGRLVVVDNKNKHLLIMNENLEKKGIRTFTFHPQDVFVVCEEEVAVTSGYGYLIEFLHVSKNYDITLTKSVKTTAPYSSICLMNETTFLVSTFNYKRQLRMITLTGEEKDFDNLPGKQNKIGDSASTYIRNKDIAVLTDKQEDTIYMYEVRKRSFPRRVVKHKDIKKPIGVCIGPDDRLFVCVNSTGCIVQVSSSGKVVATHKLDMDLPHTMCVSKDGRRMAVSSNALEERKLQLFHLL